VSEQSATRVELETAIRRLIGDTSSLTENVTSASKKAGPAVGVLGALLAYAWGKRRGRRRRVRVEIVKD
jgi:hypothetical protein